MLVYAPLGVALALAGETSAAIAGGAVVLALAMLPDCDSALPIDHRGPTHTLLFGLLVGAVLGGGTAVLTAGDPWAAAFAFVVGTLAVLSHLLADVLTPMGIRPFWPLSDRRYSLELTPAADPVANYILLGLGTGVTAVALVVLSALA